MSEKTIALLGQPNSGKSTLFNGLTGSRQHVGNWPGKTVERKDGSFVHKDTTYKIIDLPGTYSLSANSDEEVVTRNYIASGRQMLFAYWLMPPSSTAAFSCWLIIPGFAFPWFSC